MPKTMTCNDFISLFQNYSLFELYRIKALLDNELEAPNRIRKAREQFKVGDVVEYFDANSNTYIKAIIESKDQKYVSLINCHDNCRWKIRYHMLKLDLRPEFMKSEQLKITRNTLRVGDLVGFNYDGTEIVGRVVRLNQKTASIVTLQNRSWRVGYALLRHIIEGEQGEAQVLPY